MYVCLCETLVWDRPVILCDVMQCVCYVCDKLNVEKLFLRAVCREGSFKDMSTKDKVFLFFLGNENRVRRSWCGASSWCMHIEKDIL